ncbi:MAG: hypothetical protein FWG90_03020 [Oscillospiraceae bacterium]|nr:hypothetical protein [Oscillospiraceae bacterium]
MFWLKLAALLVICAASVGAAVYFTDSYVAQTAAKQKTIADVLIANNLKEALQRAEDAARAELAEHNIDLDSVTKALETKPPVIEIPPETTTPPLPEATERTETTETSETAQAELPHRLTEYKRGGLLPDRASVKPRSLISLTQEEYEFMMNFLIKHYFLDGYMYAAQETEPAYKAQKLHAAEMQGYITESLDLVMGLLDVSDPMSILNADFHAVIAQTEALKAEFSREYSNTLELGDEFYYIYQSGIKYLDRLIEALGNLKAAADNYNNAANPLIAAMILANSVDNVLLPEILGALDSSYDITEACQEIFLEGTVGAWLLTREEVAEIFSNPGLVLAIDN